MSTDDFPAIFEQLKKVLSPFADRLLVKQDTAAAYSLDTPYAAKWKRELFFGSVQMGKSYVSFHLMPVYMYPELLAGVSEPLKKRMQGKSCFNFKRADPELFAELEELTRRGFARLEEEQLV
jgi:hypothetical protein